MEIQNNKYATLFDTEQLKKDMKQRTIRGGMITSGGNAVLFVLRLASIVILARMVVPEHFGLIGMVTALTALIERFQDIGLGDAIIQKKNITHEQVSNLFWISIGICITFGVMVALSAKAVAWFYGDQRLTWITVAFGSNIVFSGSAIQHWALIRRRMRFDHSAVIDISSTTFGLGVALVLAYLGYGYWALVWKEVSRSMVVTLLAWSLCPWRPSLPVRSAGVKSIIKFGGNITGYNILFYLSQNLDSILLGKFFGAVQVGLYSRAKLLTGLPVAQLLEPAKNVSLPVLSALQSDPVTYRKYFGKILEILAFIYMPLVTYIGIYADPIVYIALGPQWMDAVPIFRLLAISFFVSPIVALCGMLLISSGQGKRYFLWGLFTNFSRVIFLMVGINWGMLGIASSWSISTSVNLIFSLFFVFKRSPVNMVFSLMSICRPAIASISMGIALLVTYKVIASFNVGFQIAVSTAFASVTYLIIWIIFPGGYRKIVEFASYPLTVFKNEKKMSVNERT
jgi:PST family polysaccharide transporter